MSQAKRHPNRSQPTNGRSPLLWCAVILLLAAAAFGITRLNRSEKVAPVEPIDPPTIATEGVDPAVVKAIELATSQVQAEPASAAKWGSLALVLAAHEFDRQAATCYAQAAALAPEDPKWPYLHAKGMLLTTPDKAVPLLNQAVEICGSTPPAPRLTLVETLLELYRLDEADEELLKFEGTFKADPRARLARARLTFLRNDNKGCLQQLKTLSTYLATQPKYQTRMQPLLLMMSECMRRLGDTERSEQIRQQGLAQGNPSWPDPYQKLVRERKTGLKAQLIKADLLFGRKKYDESIELLSKTIQAYPEAVWARILLGRALIRTGAPDSPREDRLERLSRAEEVLNGALAIDPNSVEAIFRLAVAKGYALQDEAAAELYRRAVELKPDFTMAHYNLALNYRKQNDLEAAVDAMEKAVRAEPDFVTGRVQLGDMLTRLGQHEEALKHLNVAVKLAPTDMRIRDLLGRARRMQAADSPE